jgi:hypothetical protein
MAREEIGKLTLHLNPDALKKVIGEGRVLELAATMAREAALQMPAQIVDHVAKAALAPATLGGTAAEVAYIVGDEGGFGTPRPRPHWGVVELDTPRTSPLQVFAGAAAQES